MPKIAEWRSVVSLNQRSEIKKWMAGSTKREIKKNTSDFPIAVGTDKRDIQWLRDRITTGN
jgi:hypothetical protein